MKKFLIAISVLAFFLTSCKDDPPASNDFKTTPYNIDVPKYFPILNQNPRNPMTVEGFELGRKLYYDPILSNDGRSCATCHDQKYNFTTYASNALVHVNLGWNSNFLWNGLVTGTLEDIMMFEVGDFFKTDISNLNNSNVYKELFKKAYNIDIITKPDLAFALAQFFRARVSYNSKFDKFIKGETDLTPSELNGYILYTTEKGDCFHCHPLPLTSDNQFRNIGLDSVIETPNLGRYEVTHNSLDRGKFKVPTLRNIEVSAPYMHDGRFKTLAEVVEFYNSGVKVSSTIDPIMTKPGKEYGLKLTTKEKSDLISFLKTFTDTSYLNNKTFSKP